MPLDYTQNPFFLRPGESLESYRTRATQLGGYGPTQEEVTRAAAQLGTTQARDIQLAPGSPLALQRITSGTAQDVAGGVPTGAQEGDVNTQIMQMLQKYQQQAQNLQLAGTQEQLNRIQQTPQSLIGASPALQESVRNAAARALAPTIGGAKDVLDQASNLLTKYQQIEEKNKQDSRNEFHDLITTFGGDWIQNLDSSQKSDWEKRLGYKSGTLDILGKSIKERDFAQRQAGVQAGNKTQDKLENEYRQVLLRPLAARSGGIGLEDQKVNQAIHLRAIFDQYLDPNTGEYNIPKVLYNELAIGLARLISPIGVSSEATIQGITQRTLKGDLAGAFTYITGTPVKGTTKEVLKLMLDSIDRQGEVAESNREGYMTYLRGLKPTDLDQSRADALEKGTLNSYSDYVNKKQLKLGSLHGTSHFIPDIEQPQPGLFQRLRSAVTKPIQEQGGRFATSLEAYGRGQQTLPETSLQAVGQTGLATAGITGGILGEITPEPVKKGIGFLAGGLGSTPIPKTGVSVGGFTQEVVSELSDRWNKFSQENPRVARNIEAAGGIAALIPELLGLSEAGELGVGIAKKGVQEGRAAIETTKGIFAKRAEQRAEQRASQSALDAITPRAEKLSPTEYEELARKGKISPRTGTKPGSYILDENEKNLAQKYSGLLQDKDPIKNLTTLTEEIIRKDSLVETYLKSQLPTATAFNDKELKSYLMNKLEPITDISVPSESRLLKAKKDLVDTFVNKLDKNDMPTLWRARKEFDQEIENKLNAFAGTPTLKKDLARGLRNGAQDFISEKTDNVTYKGFMKDMTELYDLSDNVGTKALQEKGLSGIQVWAKNNPNKARMLKWGIGLTGVVIGEKTLKGLGVPYLP